MDLKHTMISNSLRFYLLVSGIMIHVLTFSQYDEINLIEKFYNDSYPEIIDYYNQTSDSDKPEYLYFWSAKTYDKLALMDSMQNTLLRGGNNYPDSKRLNLLLINTLFENGQYINSLKRICDFELRFESISETYKQKTLILESLGRHSEAIDYLQNILASDTLNRYVIIHLGDNHIKIDSIYKANYYYQRAYQLDTNNYTVIKKYIYTLLHTTPDKAIPIANNLIKYDSTSIFAWKSLASSFYKLKIWDSSMLALNKLLILGDSSISTLKRASILKCSMKDFHSARPLLKKAVQIDSTLPELFYYYGLSLANSMLVDSSFYYFDKALKLLWPDSILIATIYADIALTYRVHKSYNESLINYMKAYNYNNRHCEYLYSQAIIYDHNLKDLQKALEYYNYYIESAENQYGSNLGQNIERLGSIEYSRMRIKEIKEELFFQGKSDENK